MEPGSDQTAQGSEGPQMIMQRLCAATACASALLIAGCGGKILYPHYYTLDIPPAPRAAVTGPLMSMTVAVRRFETPSYLRQGRIVYRPAPAEIGFYEYHRWVTDPSEMVTSAVMDSLRASHLFSFVKRYDGQGQNEYIMGGRLERLEEIDSAEGVRVVVRLSADLMDFRTGAVVWAGAEGETLAVDTRNVNSVVTEMSRAVEKSIDGLVASLRQRLPENAPVVR